MRHKDEMKIDHSRDWINNIGRRGFAFQTTYLGSLPKIQYFFGLRPSKSDL